MKWLLSVAAFSCFSVMLAGEIKDEASAIASAQRVAKAFITAVDAGNSKSAANYGYVSLNRRSHGFLIGDYIAHGFEFALGEREALLGLGKARFS